MKFRRCIFTFSINHDIRHFPILLCLCKNGKGDVSKKVMHFLSCYFACQWLEVFGFCFFYVLVAVASLDRYVPIDMDDVSCQNWPITGYTRSWYTEMMYWKKCLQAPLPVSPKLLTQFSHNFSRCAFSTFLEPWTALDCDWRKHAMHTVRLLS